MAVPQAIDIRISMLRLAPQCFAFTSYYVSVLLLYGYNVHGDFSVGVWSTVHLMG